MPSTRTLVACLIGAIAVAAQAQTVPTPLPMPRVGVFAGIDRSTFGGDAPGARSRSGATGGVMLVTAARSALSIQTELAFAAKGADGESRGPTLSFRLNFLELPVLARFDIPAARKAKPFVYAGPAIALRLSCNAGWPGLTRSISPAVRYDWGLRHIASGTNTTNRVLSVIVGYEWPLGRRR